MRKSAPSAMPRIVACALLFLSGAFFPLARAYALQPREGARLLQNDMLAVEVMDPGHPARYNRGPRFSNLANVLQVVHRGRAFLHSPDGHDPVTENGGLANEFDLLNETPPPGFTEAAPGEGFVKIGVGVLRKTTADYLFWEDYPVLAPASTRVVWERDRARFHQTSEGVNGLAYILEAEVSLDGSAIVIRHTLKNIGDNAIETEHYAHNFMAFFPARNRAGVLVELPYDSAPPDPAFATLPGFSRQGRTIRLTAELTAPVNLAASPPEGWHGQDLVTLTEQATGARVDFLTTPPARRIALHATPRYVCPEQFIRIRVEPGESAAWTRRYAFHAPDHD